LFGIVVAIAVRCNRGRARSSFTNSLSTLEVVPTEVLRYQSSADRTCQEASTAWDSGRRRKRRRRRTVLITVTVDERILIQRELHCRDNGLRLCRRIRRHGWRGRWRLGRRCLVSVGRRRHRRLAHHPPLTTLRCHAMQTSPTTRRYHHRGGIPSSPRIRRSM
jgi:hypothetical protein